MAATIGVLCEGRKFELSALVQLAKRVLIGHPREEYSRFLHCNPSPRSDWKPLYRRCECRLATAIKPSSRSWVEGGRDQKKCFQQSPYTHDYPGANQLRCRRTNKLHSWRLRVSCDRALCHRRSPT